LGMLGFATHSAVNVFQYFLGIAGNANQTPVGVTYGVLMRDGPIPQEAAISLPFIILGSVSFMVRTNPVLHKQCSLRHLDF
jgi:hypothetical protein